MSRTATLVIDMLNPYDHPDADPLVEQVRERIPALERLIDATRDSEHELIYVNDNHEDFTATSKDLGEAAMQGRHPELIEPILPRKGALFVQKVRHSAFYSSALDYLLKVHGIDTLILAGQVTEQCILYSALDAYLRDYKVRIPTDAVAGIEPELGEAALRMMESNMKADLVTVDDALG